MRLKAGLLALLLWLTGCVSVETRDDVVVDVTGPVTVSCGSIEDITEWLTSEGTSEAK